MYAEARSLRNHRFTLEVARDVCIENAKLRIDLYTILLEAPNADTVTLNGYIEETKNDIIMFKKKFKTWFT